MRTALISIREPHASAIFDGRKRYEYRTRAPSLEGPTKFLVYVPSPEQEVRGCIVVEDVLSGPPEALWEETADEGGVEEATFAEYFEGREEAHALQIARAHRASRRLSLSDLRGLFSSDWNPPQFFRWVDGDTLASSPLGEVAGVV